jgi:two-component system, cell cycle sensor histidine kinase and response regulator CckA
MRRRREEDYRMIELGSPTAQPATEFDPLSSLFHLSAAPMWVHHAATLRLLDANEAALDQFGYRRTRLLELTLAELDASSAGIGAMPALVDGEPARFRLRRGDGAGIELELQPRRIEHRSCAAWLVVATDLSERLRLEQELAQSRRSEQRFQQLFDNASDWFWETDGYNRLTYLSRNVEAVLGLPVSAYLGRRLSETQGIIIEPESRRSCAAAIIQRKPYRDFIYRRKLPNGDIVWINSSGVPYHDEQGKFRGYRGIARDITAHIEAERKLRESERRFRQLFEIAADHYWEVDQHQRVTYITPNYEALTGICPTDMVGKRLDEYPNIAVDPEMGRIVLMAVRSRQPYRDFVYSIKLANGKTRWISLSGIPVFAADGSFTGYRGVGADITARVEADQAARLAQRSLHDAVSYVTQPFVVYDGHNRTLAFNQAFAELHRVPGMNTPVCQGVSFAELAAWQLRVGFYAEDAAVTASSLAAAFKSGEEYAYHLKDGRWMLVVYRRLPGDGRVGLWTDITAIKRAEADRRSLEEQLHHSQRLEALGTLAGGVAHELNNALVPVIALTKLVARKLPDESRERRNLDMVIGAAHRSRDLVDKILEFSRKESDRARECIDLADVLRRALGLMRATVPTSIGFMAEIAPTPMLEADPNQLLQVLVNLITNAAQAIGAATGTITLRLAPADGGQVVLSVCDTGCGMEEATKARIFEPFFTTRVVGEGTGLGLAVVHGIIQSHGGRIEVESRPGAGARFDIILPVRSAAAA